MIFLWLKSALLFVLKLLIPPPTPAIIPAVDLDAQCPGCGHRNGKIDCVLDQHRTVVRHTCHECGLQWNVATVVKTDKIRPTRT